MRATGSVEGLRAAEPEPGPPPGSAAKGVWRHDALRRRLLAGADALALLSVTLGLGVGTQGGALATAAVTLAGAALAVLWARILRLYDRDHRVFVHGVTGEIPGLLAWTGGLAVIAASFRPALDGVPLAGGSLGLFALLLLGSVAGLRTAARVLWRQITPRERVVIIGSDSLAFAMRRKFEVFSDLHFELVGVVDGAVVGHDANSVLNDLAERHGSLDRIVIAERRVEEALIAELLPLCRLKQIKLGLVPPARGMFGTAVQLDYMAELPVVQYNTWNVGRSTMLAKRLLDIVVATLVIVLVWPLILILAVAVKADSPGPAFFRQSRAGRGGKPFKLLKLRTMCVDAEERLSALIEIESLSSPVFKLQDDPRVTRVGRWLRRSSMDEIPQIINVLRGHMSLVGPRPEQLDLVERYQPEVRRIRLALKPGLTGPMQVSGRGQLSMEERLAVEREYVENLAITRDLTILGQTAAAVIRGRGAA